MDDRKAVGLIIAAVVHVEKNTPTIFPPPTIERLEAAADELLFGSGMLSFETHEVVRRIKLAIEARHAGTSWGPLLADALESQL